MKSTREKIIVGLMVVAVGYFIVDFFWATAPEPPPTEAHDAALALATDLQLALAAGDFEPPEHLIVALAQLRATAWSPAAFVEADLVPPEPDEADEEQTFAAAELQAAAESLLYSGYLEMNGRRLAVINGQEYAVGDEVKDRLLLLAITAHYLELGLGEHRVRVPIVDLE